MTKKTAEIDMKKIDPEQVGETTEAAYRRIARRKLLERGFEGDVDAEVDRLLRSVTRSDFRTILLKV
jgi:hypothetical protein